MEGLRKKWNKTGQYLSEKFGRAQPTTFDDDFLTMEKRVAVTDKLIDELISAITKYLYPNPAARAKMRAASAFSRLVKRQEDSNDTQGLPESRIGDVMLARSPAFEARPDIASDLFKAILESHGNAFKMMADLRHALESHVRNDFIKPLGDAKKDIQEIHTLRRRLEGHRLDYDGHKRRKDRGGNVTDEQLRLVQEKFNQSRMQTREAMKNFIDRETEKVSAIRTLREELADFHHQSLNVLQQLSQNANGGRNTSGVSSSRVDTKLDAWGDDREQAYHPKNVVLPAADPKIVVPPPPQPSSVQTNEPTANDNPFTTFYRALYDSIPSSDEPDSLAFKEGDIIAMIEESDDRQWFVGSVDGRTGYVPYNYVQIIEESPH